MATPKSKKLDNTYIFQMVKLLLQDGLAPSDIQKVLKDTRPVYANKTLEVLREALQRGLLNLRVPDDEVCAEQLEHLFGFSSSRTRVVVAGSREPDTSLSGEHTLSDPEAVPRRAAQIAVQFLAERAEGSGETCDVGLGLGPGIATQLFTRHLGELMSNRSYDTKSPLPGEKLDDRVRLELFALTASVLPANASVAPISFFNEIPAERVAARWALCAPNLVQLNEWEQLKSRSGVTEARQAARERVELVVTAMGDARDRDILKQLFQREGLADRLDQAGYIGNVQYRPFNAGGPIEDQALGWRTANLFDIDELVDFRDRRDKRSILMINGKSVEAIIPLLTHSSLRVFTDVVISLEDAERVIQEMRARE